MNRRNSLPGIVAIYTVPSRLLQPFMEEKHLSGIPVGIFAEMKKCPFFGSPKCENVSTPQNNGELEKATLTFNTVTPIVQCEPLAFIVRDAAGNSWCIGSREHPHVVVSLRKYIGPPGSEMNALTYTVTRTSVRAMIPCNV